MKKELIDRILKSEKIEWRKLQWMQNSNLKELSDEKAEKLINSLDQQDFVAPFYVWHDEATDTNWILDGCHREKILHLAESKEVFTVPDKLTAIFIKCANKKEAAELVLVYSAVYAETTKQGLLEYIAANELDIAIVQDIAPIPMIEAAEFSDYEDAEDSEAEDDSADDEADFEAEPPEEPLTVTGDVYELHSLDKNTVHRIICGDCLHTSVLEKLMGSEEASMVFIDPPYNVSIKKDIGSGDSKNGIQKHDEFAMASGEMSVSEFQQFLLDVFKNLTIFSKSGSIHYVCMDWKHIYEIISAGRKAYTEFKQLCVWKKNNGGMGTFYRSQHELVFVFKNGTEKHTNNFKLGQTGRYRTNVWDYDMATSFGRKGNESVSGKETNLHPTPKPVPMVMDACLDCSNENEIVVDVFLGSGTTLMATEQTGRRFRGTEIAPKYVDVSVARYIAYKIQKVQPFKVLRNGEQLSSEDMDKLLEIVR